MLETKSEDWQPSYPIEPPIFSEIMQKLEEEEVCNLSEAPENLFPQEAKYPFNGEEFESSKKEDIYNEES